MTGVEILHQRCGDYDILLTNMMTGKKWYEDGVALLAMMMTTIVITNEDDNDFDVD